MLAEGTCHQRIAARGFAQPALPKQLSQLLLQPGHRAPTCQRAGGAKGIVPPLHQEAADADGTEKGGARNEGEAASSLQTVYVGRSASPGL